MNVKSPLGSNYGWVVGQDHYYAPREIDEDVHSALAVYAVLNDVELGKIEKNLHYSVILGVRVGKHTLHVRIYKRVDVQEHPDWLPSRSVGRDTSAYMVFNAEGGLELIEGPLRARAQGHSPAYYAERTLSPQRQNQLDAMERQLRSTHIERFGNPKPGAPLLTDSQWPETIKSDTSPVQIVSSQR